MRNLFCILFALGFAVSVSAQKVYFIYLQTENGSPFYVKMGDNILSSTSSGYLILSELVDSTYQLSIGFPSTNQDYKFRLSPGGKDKGFLIKHFDFGWGLYDLQALSILKPMQNDMQGSGTYRMKNDNFTLLLSKAAGDTSLLWVAIPAKNDLVIAEPVKKEEIARPDAKENREVVMDTPVTASRETILKDSVENLSLKHEPPADSITRIKDRIAESRQKELKQDPLEEEHIKDTVAIDIPLTEKEDVKLPAEFKRSTVKKYSESSTSEGFGLVYFDQHENGIDTIRLIIPNPPVMLKQDEAKNKDEKLFLDISNTPVKVNKVNTTVPKNNCPDVASEADFHKLRKNMAGEETDEDMVAVAKKYFRNTCFSTEQVKNLGVLFLTSAGKYLFFDAAYFHVTDRENFPALGAEISDSYYQKRFKALIGE